MLTLTPERLTSHSNSFNNRTKLVSTSLFCVSDKEVEAGPHEPVPQAAEVTSITSPVLQFMLIDNE